MSKTTILGSGAMATACSILLAEHAGQSISIWARNEEHAREIQACRENRRQLPGVRLPDVVQVSADIHEAVEGAQFLVLAIPTKYVREVLTRLAPALAGGQPVISRTNTSSAPNAPSPPAPRWPA